LSEFGIQEEISAGRTIYKISMEALRWKELFTAMFLK
jgi:hypothetical protein